MLSISCKSHLQYPSKRLVPIKVIYLHATQQWPIVSTWSAITAYPDQSFGSSVDVCQSQSTISIPLDTPKAWKMPFGRKGDVVYWGRNKFVRVFEDIEVVESTVLYENVTFLSEVNRRRVRQHLMGISSGLDPMCKVVFLKDIPDEFLFLVDSPYDRGNSLVDYEL